MLCIINYISCAFIDRKKEAEDLWACICHLVITSEDEISLHSLVCEGSCILCAGATSQLDEQTGSFFPDHYEPHHLFVMN